MKLPKNGFSLVEVLVAGAVLAGLALVLAKLGLESAKNSKTADSNMEMSNVVRDISATISVPENCKATAYGPIGHPISAIKKKSTSGFIETYKVNEPYGNNSFVISSMKTIQLPTGVNFSVTFQRTDQKTYGGKEITKNIPIDTLMTGISIDECGAAMGGGGVGGAAGATIPVYKMPDGTLTTEAAIQTYPLTCQFCSGPGGTGGSCTPDTCPPGFGDSGYSTDDVIDPVSGSPLPCGPSAARYRITTRNCTGTPVPIGKLLAL